MINIVLADALPEIPNLFTLLNLYFEGNPLTSFLHHFEIIFFSLLAMISIPALFSYVLRKKEMIPDRAQNFLEWILEGMQKIATEVLGEKGDKYVPFLGTLFVYILTINLMGLVPFLKAPSSSLNVTIALALVVFFYVQFLNIKHQGVKGFLFHLAGSPTTFIQWAIVPLMFPIELLTQLTRPLTLALRLFGNVFGEEVLIAAFIIFGMSLLPSWEGSLGIPLQIPFMFFSLLTSLMQALVFTLLTAIYILLSMPEEEGQH